MTENNGIKSIYKIGAEDGALMGVYFVVMFMCNVYAATVPVLGLLGLAMFIGTPFAVWFMVNRTRVANQRYRFFSAYWMHGIMIFVCASLILGMALYLYLRFVNPTYLHETMCQSAEVFAATDSPDAQEWATMMRRLADSGQPTPIVFAFSAIWLTAFTGSVLSLFIALVAKLLPLSMRRDNNHRY